MINYPSLIHLNEVLKKVKIFCSFNEIGFIDIILLTLY